MFFKLVYFINLLKVIEILLRYFCQNKQHIDLIKVLINDKLVLGSDG